MPIFANMKKWFLHPEPTLPKEMSPNEEKAVQIVQHLITRPDSDMYYDPETFEWYIEATPYFVVMEVGKVIVINTDYSHEVRVQMKTEDYLSHICSKETSKRRQAMKQKYLGKVKRNLNVILDSIKKMK
jgi:hypothetical protein